MARDKILILCQDRQYVHHSLEKLFKHELPQTSNIIKSIPWENKYYNVKFDLYIDEIDTNLQDWFAEFITEECQPLREVLAGIIFVLPFDKREDLDFIQSHLEDEDDMFLICSDPNAKTEQPHWEEYSTTLDITTLTDSQDKNEYGELMGILRIQEIIDTYPWTHSEIKQQSTIPSKQDIDDSIEIQHLMSKLEEAKLKYSQNKDDSMAQELSEEIANLIFDS
ncbi:increased recombination centers protein 6 [Monosporozyma servazzii]